MLRYHSGTAACGTCLWGCFDTTHARPSGVLRDGNCSPRSAFLVMSSWTYLYGARSGEYGGWGNCPPSSVSVAASNFVRHCVLAHFHLQIFVDDVKSSWTEANCTLQLIKCYASLRQDSLGFGFVLLVEGMSSEDWCLHLSVQFPYHFSSSVVN